MDMGREKRDNFCSHPQLFGSESCQPPTCKNSSKTLRPTLWHRGERFCRALWIRVGAALWRLLFHLLFFHTSVLLLNVGVMRAALNPLQTFPLSGGRFSFSPRPSRTSMRCPCRPGWVCFSFSACSLPLLFEFSPERSPVLFRRKRRILRIRGLL